MMSVTQRYVRDLHLMAVTLKQMTMFRKFIVAVTAIFVSALAVSAQTSGSGHERHNRWMVGGQFLQNSNGNLGFGATGIYGRQFSESIFLGVGFGMDTYIAKNEEISMTITDDAGNQTVKVYPPYQYSFIIPVYADLQVNLNHRRAPFFGELKIGGALDTEIVRLRGTEKSNDLEIKGGGILLGAGAGKRFVLRNEDEISVILSVDCILWPFYVNVPISLGFRYGF